ncbi:MAG: glycosyltransferase family 2 protein [Bryobacteraceae bacterium]
MVIPTKNRPHLIPPLLAALRKQTAPPAEVIIVDQSEGVVTESLHAQASDGGAGEGSFTWLRDPRIDGLAAARNVGLRLTTTSYVIFLDDDALPEPDCLSLLIEALDKHPNLLAVGGLVSNYAPPPFLGRLFRRMFYLGALYDERQPTYWRARRYQPGELIPTTKLNGGCMAFRREVLLEIGGFDSRYRGASVGEDVEISQRLIRRAGRQDALALVGGAFIHHASEGAWKSNARAIEFELVATHYWFTRNHPWNLANRFRFFWMCCGLWLWSVASAAKRRNAGPLRGFLAGLDSIRHNYRGCPFLKEEQPLSQLQTAP